MKYCSDNQEVIYAQVSGSLIQKMSFKIRYKNDYLVSKVNSAK